MSDEEAGELSLEVSSISPTARLAALGGTATEVWIYPGDDRSAISHSLAEFSEAAGGPGPRLGRFRIMRELGAGGMGRVLEARDPELRRSVAVKVMLDPTKFSANQLGRFVAEAQITSQLQHPNIVPIYDLGVEPGGPFYIVMKRVEGASLDTILSRPGAADDRGGAWTTQRLLGAFVQVCNAVGYAHERGVLHRDLKPDNLMLGRLGEVYVMDWGIARTIGDTTERTTETVVERATIVATVDGATIGTPGYMSPEQCEGELAKLDGRSDVFSLGAILYRILTRADAFPGDNIYLRIAHVLTSPRPDPRHIDPTIPAEIADLCISAMAISPADRPQSAAALGQAVQDFIDGSKRRREADAWAARAEEALTSHEATIDELWALAADRRTLAATVKPWAPLDDPEKVALQEARAYERRVGRERVRSYDEVLRLCDRALAGDPRHRAARAVLARLHAGEAADAERRGDDADLEHHLARLGEYDDGTHAAVVAGEGTVHLRTEPPGLRAVATRVVQEGLVWTEGETVDLGSTPLVDHRLPAGAWVIRLSDGMRTAVHPLLLRRGGGWSPQEPVRVPLSIPEGFVAVTAGPASIADPATGEDDLVHVPGFAMAKFPVTMAEYAEFLTRLHGRDPDEAWDRVPRQESGAASSGGQYWDRPPDGVYRVPEVDRDGDAWDPRLPAHSISHDDALAFLAWRAERDGRPYRLATEREWEKAARGADGRRFPWGSEFDPALCKMRVSRQGRPHPEPIGAFPTDRSVYGVRDLAGSMREWCADVGTDPDRRRIRGGAWYATETGCEATHRIEAARWTVNSNLGFRLVFDLD